MTHAASNPRVRTVNSSDLEFLHSMATMHIFKREAHAFPQHLCGGRGSQGQPEVGAMETAERMTEQELATLEKRLIEVVGTSHCDVADFATRGMVRLLAHARAVARENASLRATVRASVGANAPVYAQRA